MFRRFVAPVISKNLFQLVLIQQFFLKSTVRVSGITLRLLTFVPLKDYLPLLVDMGNDTSLPKYATHVVYLTKSGQGQMKKRIINSIFANPAKRADFYWLININRVDEPFTMEYNVEVLLKKRVIKVNLNLGFRIQPKIGIMLKKIAAEMMAAKEISMVHRFPAVHKEPVNDFRFVILKRFLFYNNEFSDTEGFILNRYFSIIKLARTDSEAYGIDRGQAVVEEVPLVVSPLSNVEFTRTF